MKERVAFLISIYGQDRRDFFEMAIDSIVSQSYGFENIDIYLGIDGAIDDDLRQYIDENRDLFTEIVENGSNRGLAFTLNRLIEELGDEKFIFRMDADDICREDRVVKSIEFFDRDDTLMMAGSDLLEIDSSGTVIRYKKMPNDTESIIKYSIARNPFNHPTVCLRKDFFDIVGKYDETILKSQDYELWSRALKMNLNCSNIPEPLLYFRITDDYMNKRNSLTNSLSELKISWSNLRHFGYYGQLPKIVAKFIMRLLPPSLGNVAYDIIRDKKRKNI
jgi:hypothetical protein